MRINDRFSLVCQAIATEDLEKVLAFKTYRRVDHSFLELREEESCRIASSSEGIDYFS